MKYLVKKRRLTAHIQGQKKYNSLCLKVYYSGGEGVKYDIVDKLPDSMSICIQCSRIHAKSAKQ